MSTINLDGQDRKLDLRCASLFEAEKYPEEFGEGEFDVMEFLNKYDANRTKAHWLKRILWLLLFNDSPELTPKDVENMLRESNISIIELGAKIGEALRFGTPAIESDEKKKIVTKVTSKLPKKS